MIFAEDLRIEGLARCSCSRNPNHFYLKLVPDNQNLCYDTHYPDRSETRDLNEEVVLYKNK